MPHRSCSTGRPRGGQRQTLNPIFEQATNKPFQPTTSREPGVETRKGSAVAVRVSTVVIAASATTRLLLHRRGKSASTPISLPTAARWEAPMQTLIPKNTSAGAELFLLQTTQTRLHIAIPKGSHAP